MSELYDNSFIYVTEDGLFHQFKLFQTFAYSSKILTQHKPSFLNRLVGTEDDQLQCIISPYTAR